MSRHDGDTTTRIGYVIPEFPGQTHIWMWREISHLRSWGANITIFSTRMPPERDLSRHEFTAAALKETVFLWPMGRLETLGHVFWSAVRHPIGFLKCIQLACSLPISKRPVWRHLLPLIVPAARLAREVERRKIDRLHSHSCANSAILCMMVKRINRTPYSLVLNANVEWWGGAMNEKFQEAEFTDCIAQWLLDQVRRDHPTLRPDQTLLARVGVDTEKWKPATDPRRMPGPFRIACVSRLSQTKGHADLLQAFRMLLDRGHDAILELIGTGPEKEALEAKVRELGLSGRVVFHGSLSENQIIEQLARADAFALASHAEPLGVVYMEAMSMGLPTIGTAAGGVGEIIQSDINGILVPPQNPGSLSDALERLIKDPSLRERLGAKARQSIIENFDSRIGASVLFERFYERLPGAIPVGR